MKRLSGTDALFLSLETPAWHQHVGGLTILETGKDGLDFEAFCKRVDERLNLAPKFKWKLKNTPLGLDVPAWVDDRDFDVRRHVRRIAVPAPGGPKETAEVAGTLLGMQLDRRWPLWELWVMEGLVHDRTALLMKYHHCLLDGVAGASLATALMDIEPDATESLAQPPEETSAGADPSDLRLAAGAAVSLLKRPVRTARYLGGTARMAPSLLNSLRDPRNRAILRAPKTRFNGAIGPRRALAFASVAIDDLRALRTSNGVKVNDVLLALYAGALRGYLVAKGELPEAPLVCGVPISTRAEGDTTADNQITSAFIGIATDVADPVERLQRIAESTRSAKQMTKALSAHEIQSIGEVAAPLLISMVIRGVYGAGLLSRAPMRINTLLSNVPGPPIPLFVNGAKVTGIYPSSVILETMGINATVFTYADRADFGVHVDPDLVPDPWAITRGIPEALAELMAASGLGEPTKVRDPFDA